MLLKIFFLVMEKAGDILIFFGRFHTLVVHLPIGFLFLAILFETLAYWPQFKSFKPVVPFIWLLGALTVTLAVVLGYMLSSGGGYDEDSLSLHKWSGFALCFFSFICYFYKKKLGPSPKNSTKYFYVFLIGVTSILLIQTGHVGGTLTHGPDYLAEYAPSAIRKFAGISEIKPQTQRRITTLDSADIFEDAVKPIVDSKCVGCHNKNKKKGQLILTSFDEMLAGGETAPGIIPGNLATSEIYRRITLPEGHEDFMPGEGKTPLSKEQISIIEWWIENNAPRNGSITSLSPNDKMVNTFKDFFGMNREFGMDVPPADPSLLKALAEKGYRINTLSKNTNLLEVKFKNKNSGKPETATLPGIKDQLIWLDLSNCGISDEDLKTIGSLPNLMKLNLHGNNISDNGVQYLAGLSKLEYLNLYDTNVTDDCIMSFASFEKLKRVYLWNTRVISDARVDSLRIKRPDLSIVYKLPFEPAVGAQPDSLRE